MKRIRLAALLAALLPGMVAGCSTFGNGPIMSRLRGNHSECPCEAGGGFGPCCDGPPLGEGMAAGPMLPPPGMSTIPPLSPAPRLIDPGKPTPAAPSSRTK